MFHIYFLSAYLYLDETFKIILLIYFYPDLSAYLAIYLSVYLPIGFQSYLCLYD